LNTYKITGSGGTPLPFSLFLAVTLLPGDGGRPVEKVVALLVYSLLDSGRHV